VDLDDPIARCNTLPMGDLPIVMSAGRDKRIARLLIAIFVASILMSYLAMLLPLRDLRPFNDSNDYLHLASLSVFSKAFWTGDSATISNSRPPLVPILFKLCGGMPGSIVTVQLILALVSWGVLGACCVRLIGTNLRRGIALALLLFLATCGPIVQWHYTVLTESLSLTLFTGLTAAWLAFAAAPDTRKTVAVALLSLMFGLSRDINALILATFAPILIVASYARRIDPTPRRLLWSLGVWYLAIFIGSSALVTAGNRWVFPYYNLVQQRILPDEKKLDYFAAKGMPVNERLMDYAGKVPGPRRRVFYVDEDVAGFRDWSSKHGRGAYTSFLLTHPGYLIGAPLSYLGTILEADLREYRPKEFRSLIPESLGGIGWDGRLTPVWMLIAAGLLAVAAAQWKDRSRRHTLVPALMMLLSVPHLIVIWHGDAMEVERHALSATYEARLGFVLAGIFAIEHFARRRTLKSPAGDPVSGDAAGPIESPGHDQPAVVDGEAENGKVGSA
jgi:hypothetical protein